MLSTQISWSLPAKAATGVVLLVKVISTVVLTGSQAVIPVAPLLTVQVKV